MALNSKPIYVVSPNYKYWNGPSFTPYFYEDELKDMGLSAK